jgi:hypothetical protein
MKKLQHLSLKHLARYLVIAGVILGTVLVITACDEAGAAGGSTDGTPEDTAGDGDVEEIDGGDAPSVSTVQPVSLSQNAEPSDFAVIDPHPDASLVGTKTDALLLLGASVFTVSDAVEAYFDGLSMEGGTWPSENGDNSWETTPADLFEEEPTSPPTTIGLSGTLVGEAVGELLQLTADGDLTTTLTWYDDEVPTRVTGNVDATVDAPVYGFANPFYSSDYVYGGRVFGAVRANVGAAISWNGETDPEDPGYTYYYPNLIDVNASMSTRLSVAISAQADISSTEERLVYGNLLATLEWDPSLSIRITDEMLNDETGQLLADYLETIEVAEPTLTIDVYADEGDLSPTSHTYTIDQILQILEDEEALGSGDAAVLSSVITLSRALQATQGR